MDTPDLKSGITVTSTQELGTLLRQVRKSSKIKQATISGLANWGGRFIGDVENGKPTVQAQMLFDLIGWLGLEIVIRKKGSL
jgi:HTH-type transcriptional regulator/antitoxin HipB